MKLAKLVSLGLALLLIQACKHPIEIEGVGDVTSLSGTRGCTYEDATATPVPNNCANNEVFWRVKNEANKWVRVDYQETYTAVPRDGWQFDSWVNCSFDGLGLSVESGNTCTFNVPATTVKLAGRTTMPALRAVFTVIPPPLDTDGDDLNDNVDPCPLNPTSPCALITAAETVTVQGREWAQPSIFQGVGWGEIDAVCPGGDCVVNGVLNGFDVTGWTWAGSFDVLGLFSTYDRATELGVDCSAFFTSFIPTSNFFGPWPGGSREVAGYFKDTDTLAAFFGEWQSICLYRTDLTPAEGSTSASWGAWLYREPH